MQHGSMQTIADLGPPALNCITRTRSFRALWAALQQFVTARRGAVAVVTALAVTVLVFTFSGLAEIVRTTYVGDTMNRAARAAARAVALVPDTAAAPHLLNSAACAAIQRELDLGAGFDCGAQWELIVDTGLTAKGLLDASEDRDGDMVRVRILWDRLPWEFGRLAPEEVEEDEEDEVAGRLVAIGVASREPETDS